MHLLINDIGYVNCNNQINMKEKIKLNKRKLAVHCVSLEIYLVIRIRSQIPILARVSWTSSQSVC